MSVIKVWAVIIWGLSVIRFIITMSSIQAIPRSNSRIEKALLAELKENPGSSCSLNQLVVKLKAAEDLREQSAASPSPSPPPPTDQRLVHGARLAVKFHPPAGNSTFFEFGVVGVETADGKLSARVFPVNTNPEDAVESEGGRSSTTKVVPDWDQVSSDGYVVKRIPASEEYDSVSIRAPSFGSTVTTFTLYDESVIYTDFDDHRD